MLEVARSFVPMHASWSSLWDVVLDHLGAVEAVMQSCIPIRREQISTRSPERSRWDWSSVSAYTHNHTHTYTHICTHLSVLGRRYPVIPSTEASRWGACHRWRKKPSGEQDGCRQQVRHGDRRRCWCWRQLGPVCLCDGMTAGTGETSLRQST